VFQGYVGGEGHSLTRAYDGSEAIKLARSREYDLIVMDANMPVMGGYTATRAIREWESNTGRSERVPILLFSSDDPLKQAKLGGAVGCSGYLAKPATKAELLRALKFFAPVQTAVS
jgi:CheY-like chemotaxis protein